MLSLVGKSDLSMHCRVCLNQPDEDDLLDLNLIYDEEEQINYYECFTTCTHLSLDDENGFPRNLCKSCGIELQMAYDFHKRVQESQRTLRQWKEENRIIIKRETTINDDEEVNIVNVEEVPLYQIEKLEEDNVAEESPPDTDLELGFSLNSGFEILQEDLPIEEENVVNDFERDCKFEAGDTSIVVFEPLNNIAEGDETNSSLTSVDKEFLSESPNELLLEKPHNTNLRWKNEPPDEEEEESLDSIYENLEKNEKNQVYSSSKISKSDIDDPELTETYEISLLTPQKTSKTIRKKGDGPPFLCELCGHPSPSRSLLASHRHRKHRKTPANFACPKCSKVFDTKLRLEGHLRRPTCETYPEFVCEFCSKVCIGVANYNIHLRFHTKEYPFACNECDKRFMMSTHLKDHIRTKHEHKRFKCAHPDCEKLFLSKHSLKTHFLTHMETLPFKCDYCSSMHPTKGRLRFHIKRSHGLIYTHEELDKMMVVAPTKDIPIKIYKIPNRDDT